jgi:hypothetical protein
MQVNINAIEVKSNFTAVDYIQDSQAPSTGRNLSTGVSYKT